MEPIYSVSEFLDFMNLYLAGVSEVAVQGEISSIKLSHNQWFFITLKDEDSAVDVFAVASQNPICRQLEEGMLVNIYGVPKLYKKSGRFSIHARTITPAGEGGLKVAFEKLKAKLEQEGMFDPARKRHITKFPQTIGLITAKDSQAYKDFVKVLNGRMKGVKIYFYPASVQGRDALADITQAIAYFNTHLPTLDVLVLTRGGGSLEDLYTFNTEELARAIYSSKIPVVTGVGHEGDVTLADYCADLRASTPSNAAELISREMVETLNDIKHMEFRMQAVVHNKMAEYEVKVEHFAYIAHNLLGQKMAKIQATLTKFDKNAASLQTRLAMKKQHLGWQAEKMLGTLKNKCAIEHMRVNSCQAVLNALDYTKVLQRGFALVYNSEGKIVKSHKNVKINQTISTKLADGILFSKVEKVQND